MSPHFSLLTPFIKYIIDLNMYLIFYLEVLYAK